MKQFFFYVGVILILPCCIFAQSIEADFQSELDSLFAQHTDAVGVLMHVESPNRNISFTTVKGFSSIDEASILTIDHPVLVASNTKPYVAASILRLVEMGDIQLNQAIHTLISRKTNKLFADDGYDFSAITVKHLLSHTSGIADYVDDAYFDFVDSNPLYNWKKKEQFQRSIEVGNPLFVPGTDFKYGDINYLLLTEIIEKTTNRPFYQSIRTLLKFEELNLDQTWFKDLETYPKNTLPLAHQYSEENQWDSYDINPSWDLYGGGGIAATIKDAALFFQYLFEGKIIEDESVLREAYQYVLPKEKSNYCLGFRNIAFPTFTAYYHGGWWGTDVAYCPETNTTVASFTLQKSKRDKFAHLSIAFMEKLALENSNSTNSESKKNESPAPVGKYTRYQSILDSIFNLNPESVGIMVHIESTQHKISWSGSAGYSNKDKKTRLSPDQPALITSSIKPYVAATILRLQELGRLSIEDPMSKFLSEKTKALFQSDGYKIDSIKIKHLLSHTSGVVNFVNADYMDRISDDPTYRWTRDEQLELAIKVGDPLGDPGNVFNYTDTNFLLCTEIIEQVFNKPFYSSMRELLKYDALGFDHTWFPTLEEPNSKTKPLVHQYWSERGWDSYKQDLSFDLYGGGGIATNTEELAKFSYNLFNSKVIEDQKTLGLMFTKIETLDKEDKKYFLGLSEGGASGFKGYGHGGFWGTVVLYFPKLDVSISVFVLDRSHGKLRKNILDAIVEELTHDISIFSDVVISEKYELYASENSEATLVLFPGGASTAKETKEEFKILNAAAENNMSVLMMNFNRHLWIDETQTKELALELEKIFEANKLNTNTVVIGGMSIGGNVALSLSNYLKQHKSSIIPKGVFIVDSPIDLHALYLSSLKDVSNLALSEERLSEPKWIISYLEESFGTSDEFLTNIQSVSPFIIENNTNSVAQLQDVKFRMYTEPDSEWSMKNRQTEFKSTNAYTIQQLAKQLKDNNWIKLELIETKDKGYRADGERNPHSWSIVDINNLINWIKN